MYIYTELLINKEANIGLEERTSIEANINIEIIFPIRGFLVQVVGNIATQQNAEKVAANINNKGSPKSIAGIIVTSIKVTKTINIIKNCLPLYPFSNIVY